MIRTAKIVSLLAVTVLVGVYASEDQEHIEPVSQWLAQIYYPVCTLAGAASFQLGSAIEHAYKPLEHLDTYGPCIVPKCAPLNIYNGNEGRMYTMTAGLLFLGGASYLWKRYIGPLLAEKPVSSPMHIDVELMAIGGLVEAAKYLWPQHDVVLPAGVSLLSMGAGPLLYHRFRTTRGQKTTTKPELKPFSGKGYRLGGPSQSSSTQSS